MFHAAPEPRQDDWIDKLVDTGIPLSSAAVLGVIGGIYGGPTGAQAGAAAGYAAGTSTGGIVSELTGKGHRYNKDGGDKVLMGAGAGMKQGAALLGDINAQQDKASPQLDNSFDLGGSNPDMNDPTQTKRPSGQGFLYNLQPRASRANTIRSL